MLRVFPILEKWRKALPDDFQSKSITAKLDVPRGTFPAITHVDFSARVQTVNNKTLPKMWNLLDQLEKISGFDMLVNTSFNVRGEPPVCSPADAYRCFMETEMDFLVIGNLVLEKNKQPVWKYSKKVFNLD
jgi:carbamoyltransferase